MKWIDIKYIRLVSVYLQGFKEVGQNTFIFRCPVCGDSKKNTLKRRGYLYATNDGSFFKCYNCGASAGLYQFLKSQNVDLSKRYQFERFGTQVEKNDIPADLLKTDRDERFKNISKDQIRAFKHLTPIYRLCSDHQCIEYLRSRKIPLDIEMYWAPSLNKMMSSIEAYRDRQFSTDCSAVVFPFRSPDKKLNYLQARIISGDSKRRYATFEIEENGLKFWGLDRVDFTKPVYLFEGPIDAMMIDNGVAFAGGNLRQGAKYLEGLVESKLVLVYDADFKTNSDIFKDMSLAIKRDGRSVVIHDKEFEPNKDMNEAICSGWTKEEAQGYLERKTCSGLTAELKLTQIKSPINMKKWSHEQQT